jgi:potassium-transporting ATPase KdpC subunit
MQQIRSAFALLILLTCITGLIYPISMTIVAHYCFQSQAHGSLIEKDNELVGSHLIGQLFTSSKYFWGRPSATHLYPYNGTGSSGSNFGPSNLKFISSVKEKVAFLNKTNELTQNQLPIDLVCSSGSGLDPEISPKAAYYQSLRISKERGIDKKTIDKLILTHIQPRTFGILGEPRVNVLELNLALDKLGELSV